MEITHIRLTWLKAHARYLIELSIGRLVIHWRWGEGRSGTGTLWKLWVIENVLMKSSGWLCRGYRIASRGSRIFMMCATESGTPPKIWLVPWKSNLIEKRTDPSHIEWVIMGTRMHSLGKLCGVARNDVTWFWRFMAFGSISADSYRFPINPSTDYCIVLSPCPPLLEAKPSPLLSSRS